MGKLKNYLNKSAEIAAQELLGCYLEREIDGKKIVVKIVETEAYDQTDVASHSYKGVTPRTEVMFGEAGKLYVYFTYGMHYCCNVVVGTKGHGAAVLIRAVEPLEGEELISTRRKGRTGPEAVNGPAKLCQALAIDKALNTHDLEEPPLKLIVKPPLPKAKIVQTTRIGISSGKEALWRFYIKDNSFISVK